MPHTHGVIAVGDLQGASVTVTITDERAEQPTVYTDESGESAADNPATVTEATRFHVGRPGSYTVVLAIGSVPVGGGTVYLDGSEASFAPAVSAVELAQYLGGGSGLPVPGSGDAGKVVTVTGGEDGFELDAPTGGASEQTVPVAGADPTIDTTTYDDTVTGVGKLATVILSASDAVVAVAVDGDAFPRLVLTSDSLLVGDGSADPTQSGLHISEGGISTQGGSIQLNATGGVVSATSDAGLTFATASGAYTRISTGVGTAVLIGDDGTDSVIGFLGAAPVTRPAAPATLDDVIAALQALGLVGT